MQLAEARPTEGLPRSPLGPPEAVVTAGYILSVLLDKDA